MRNPVLSLSLLLAVVASVTAEFRDLPGPYCAARPGGKCCPGRDDTCTMPILGTLCYCDMFCARTNGADCCPDFRFQCLGEIAPPEQLTAACTTDAGQVLVVGQRVKVNCNWCTCRETSNEKPNLVCDDEPCVIRSEIIDAVNDNHLGWTASNYSFMWGETLAEGIERHLGTMKPDQPVMAMHGVDMNGRKTYQEQFDARVNWPGLIQPIRDQGICASSWAIAATDVAADRRAILTKGADRAPLSVQQMLDCHNEGRPGCAGGYPDRAWRYLAERGLVSEDCYPYLSGKTGTSEVCRLNDQSPLQRCPGGRGFSQVYNTPPPYRIANNENDIKSEIEKNGPVQAILLVREDFYMYEKGVYRYSDPVPHKPAYHRKSGLHSVRILGWGVDRTQPQPIKYWICANSWGRAWGEDGYFRIVRGEDESAIEMFVVGVEAKKSEAKHK